MKNQATKLAFSKFGQLLKSLVLVPPERFELTPYEDPPPDDSRNGGVRTDHPIHQDAEITLIEEGQTAVLYAMAGPALRVFLDQVCPSLKIGKYVFPRTRADNVRIINIGTNKNNDLFSLIIRIKEANKINAKERKELICELNKLGAHKLVVSDYHEFLAVLFRVDVKTIYKDIRND